jgi:hypothetical protein
MLTSNREPNLKNDYEDMEIDLGNPYSEDDLILQNGGAVVRVNDRTDVSIYIEDIPMLVTILNYLVQWNAEHSEAV